ALTAAAGADCRLASVYEGGAAHRAGLSGGDLLVALDGLRVTASNLETLLARYRGGDRATLHAFRRDELIAFTVELAADDTPRVTLTAVPASAKKRAGWLRGNK
ncbi:MAG: PDZ domain-containing protein, partial [Burkholderiaceae bacterium]